MLAIVSQVGSAWAGALRLSLSPPDGWLTGYVCCYVVWYHMRSAARQSWHGGTVRVQLSPSLQYNKGQGLAIALSRGSPCLAVREPTWMARAAVALVLLLIRMRSSVL
uniref:Uncharacterized protein n=1 Tax=Thermogemmatispora argillosa TaxID=2045280 RepID=A0A455T3Q1_9CHLR|nr:hypothetical protein KTA_34520 [Thermogemmatispora argillosa]